MSRTAQQPVVRSLTVEGAASTQHVSAAATCSQRLHSTQNALQRMRLEGEGGILV